jgi:hypothetical protein
MKQFEKLVVSGCSFSACSSNIENGIMYPTTWSQFLLPKINPNIFVNVAMNAGGNFAAGYNIVYLLETKNFFMSNDAVSNDTLVLFNITGLDRFDSMCYKDSPHANNSFSWNKDFGFGWITQGGFGHGPRPPFNGLLQKHMGMDQIITTNSLAIINTITYLEANNFQYAFMLMNQHIETAAPDFLKRFLDNRSAHYITFDGISNMYEYCEQNSLLGYDQFHPSREGHSAIADFVYRHIDKY